MSQAATMDHAFEQPSWKTIASWIGAALVALLFLSSGIWKITDPYGWAVNLHQFKVPQAITLPFAVALGTMETLAGVLILLPAYRRLGAWLATALLVVFMIYVGINYNALVGADCSCFPFVKRAVNPMFFVEDAGMIVLAAIAGIWGRSVIFMKNLRGVAVMLGAVAVCALVFLGIAFSRQTGIVAPETIQVDGKAFAISKGKVFIYFYDPECMHCVDAGERMAKLDWNGVTFIGQPVVRPQFAPAFMERTGLKGVTANDLALLKKTVDYKGTPAGVALDNGREVAALSKFEDPEPATTLKQIGFTR
jgi:uncharacterized membrane protein YphA (DoxX/SURF4 family)